jgi:hypothetical protein
MYLKTLKFKVCRSVHPTNVGFCHHGMARPQVADGEIWRVAVNKFNKQPRTADEGWSFSLGVRRGDNNLSP